MLACTCIHLLTCATGIVVTQFLQRFRQIKQVHLQKLQLSNYGDCIFFIAAICFWYCSSCSLRISFWRRICSMSDTPTVRIKRTFVECQCKIEIYFTSNHRKPKTIKRRKQLCHYVINLTSFVPSFINVTLCSLKCAGGLSNISIIETMA